MLQTRCIFPLEIGLKIPYTILNGTWGDSQGDRKAVVSL